MREKMELRLEPWLRSLHQLPPVSVKNRRKRLNQPLSGGNTDGVCAVSSSRSWMARSSLTL